MGCGSHPKGESTFPKENSKNNKDILATVREVLALGRRGRGQGRHQLRCSRYADRSSPGGRKSRCRLLTFICRLPSRSPPAGGQARHGGRRGLWHTGAQPSACPAPGPHELGCPDPPGPRPGAESSSSCSFLSHYLSRVLRAQRRTHHRDTLARGQGD